MRIVRIVFLVIIIAYSWVAFKKNYEKQGSPIGECVIAGVFATLWLLTELLNQPEEKIRCGGFDEY